MNRNISDLTGRLTDALRESDEYTRFREAKRNVSENDMVRSLLGEYHDLMMLRQAQTMQGISDEKTEERMKAVVDLLQSDDTGFEYLTSEYEVHALLSEIYKRIANSVEINLDSLDS